MTAPRHWAYSTLSTMLTMKEEIFKVNGRQVSARSLRDLLNDMGAEGWELATAETVTSAQDQASVSMYILKRPED